ncbi:hypothetical protein WDW89_16425 [Deltaproteobacteria bacterium TL4]
MTKSKEEIKESLKDDSNVDLSDIVLSLIDESSYLADVLHCSLKLMELFDPDEMVDCVIEEYHKSFNGTLRVWRVGEAIPVIMGNNTGEMTEAELDEEMGHVLEAEESGKFRYIVHNKELFFEGNYVMEVIGIPVENYNAIYIATLYFRHLIRALTTLKDRLVIVKAFQAIHEILDLKKRLEGSLHDIRDQSNTSISQISEYLDQIICIGDEIRNNTRRAEQIHEIANKALNETQIGDLTNQKIFASLHNLEKLFERLTNSLDSTSKKYLESIYEPSDMKSYGNVVSESLISGNNPVDQSSVDDLLAELGL